jgi:hypothetical protein
MFSFTEIAPSYRVSLRTLRVLSVSGVESFDTGNRR